MPDAIRVLMVPSWYPTPEAPLLGTFYREQAQAMAARGAQVTVAYVNVGDDFRPSHNGIAYTCDGGVHTYVYKRPNLTPRWERGRCFQRTRMLEKLYRRIEREQGRPDVVNLRSSLLGYEALSLCEAHDLPLFFMEHSSFVITASDGSPMRQRLRAVMEKAAVNACVSTALKRVMAPFGETRVIPDMVDTERFRPLPAPPQDGAFVFRAMGQLRPIKGYDTLIRAFVRLRAQTDRPVRLEIAGVGGLRETLQGLIDTGGVGDCCRLVGAVPRDEVPAFMNGCDCFVCSSRTETLSCVLNEAAACGKPLISTRCGGPEDIVTEEIGLLTPVDDAEALAGAMLRMLDTAAGYDPQRIREMTVSRFGVETVCAQLLDACRQAAQTKRKD